jgi:XTP/dITP diphosphohydrolase
MKTLAFGTGNSEKFTIGYAACLSAGLLLEQVALEVEEIQGEDMAAIALDKAQRAYNLFGKPMIISDDSWAIPGLGGFPGAYMKSINHWFSVQDLINLTQGLSDRSIVLTQTIVYIDAQTTRLFSFNTKGTLLKTPRGVYGKATHKIVVLDGDNGLTMAEAHDQSIDHSRRTAAKVWDDFAAWYIDYQSMDIPASPRFDKDFGR